MYFIWSKPYKTVIYIKLTSFDAEICVEQEKSHIFNNKWVVPIGIAHFLHEVENLVRESFWNVYRPGCLEHYVLHQLRNDPAFVASYGMQEKRDLHYLLLNGRRIEKR